MEDMKVISYSGTETGAGATEHAVSWMMISRKSRADVMYDMVTIGKFFAHVTFIRHD